MIFRGSRNLTLFYRDSKENPQFGGQKSKLCKDNFRGEFPPPSSVRVLTPPYPGLRKMDAEGLGRKLLLKPPW